MPRLLILAMLVASSLAAERRIGIALDVSSSMNDNDRARYTLQLAKILGDVVRPGDDVSVYRMPNGEGTGAVPNPALRIHLDPSHRDAYKQALEDLRFTTGTFFLTPIRTAIADLGSDPAIPRLLLLLTDATSYTCCAAEVDSELRRFQRTGAVVAVVGVGPAADIGRYQGLDIVRQSRNSTELVGAVAEILQRFLGGKNVQTGQVNGDIGVHIDPFVREAFLVVAADGPVPEILIRPGNPGSAGADRNYRGGGETQEVSGGRGRAFIGGKMRGYRIVRLERPRPGDWIFSVPGLSDSAGWILIQDYSVQMRLITQGAVPAGMKVPLQVEVVDEITGQRVKDPALLKELSVELKIGDQMVRLNDDGVDGDRAAGDGIFTADHQFADPGDQQVTGRVRTGRIDRTFAFTVKVQPADGMLHPASGTPFEIGRQATISVTYEALPGGQPKAPEKIRVQGPSGIMELLPVPGKPLTYEGRWTPSAVGEFPFTFTAPGALRIPEATARIVVLGSFDWSNPVPVRIGPVTGGAEAASVLDLSSARVGGEVQMTLTTDLALRRAELAIWDAGWRPVNGTPLPLVLREGGARQYPVRLKAAECPTGCRFTAPHEIILTATTATGPRRFRVPLSVEVIPSSWYYCWRYEIGLLLLLALATFVVMGYVTPSRFRRGAGVQLNCEQDLESGVFYRFRALSGVRAGFYRDAHAYVTSDYRVWGKRTGAIVRLRAYKRLILIRPEGGAIIYRMTGAGTWEPIPDRETPVQTGVLYRNDGETVFFDVRSG